MCSQCGSDINLQSVCILMASRDDSTSFPKKSNQINCIYKAHNYNHIASVGFTISESYPLILDPPSEFSISISVL